MGNLPFRDAMSHVPRMQENVEFIYCFFLPTCQESFFHIIFHTLSLLFYRTFLLTIYLFFYF